MNSNWISISINSSIGISNFTCTSKSCIFYYPCANVDFCTPYSLSLIAGYYSLEVWGAEGGGKNGLGGKGGYSSGYLELSTSKSLFLFIGSKGEYICDISSVTKPSFNGGGHGLNYGYVGHCCGSGGGGTDFRINNSIHSRILVSGGGGGEGSSVANNDINRGGYGGGNTGGNGQCIITPSYSGYGANLTHPGNNYFPGSFGFGGNNTVLATGGGGGGGWYGGGAGYTDRSSGGGGSGYYFSKGTVSPQNAGLNIEYFLESGVLLSGNDIIPTPEGGYLNGHHGSGVARISLLSAHECSCQINNYFSISSLCLQKIVLFMFIIIV